jgi:hypothetical protein
MECRHAGVLCTFYDIPAAATAAAGIARSSQLSSPWTGQAVQYFIAGGIVCTSQYKSSPRHLSFARAGHRVGLILYSLWPLCLPLTNTPATPSTASMYRNKIELGRTNAAYTVLLFNFLRHNKRKIEFQKLVTETSFFLES